LACFLGWSAVKPTIRPTAASVVVQVGHRRPIVRGLERIGNDPCLLQFPFDGVDGDPAQPD